jgi:hypothetical protein
LKETSQKSGKLSKKTEKIYIIEISQKSGKLSKKTEKMYKMIIHKNQEN